MIQTKYFVYEDYNDYKLHYCSDISILTKDNVYPLFEGSEDECKEFIDVRSRAKNIRGVKKLTSSNEYEFMFSSETNMWKCTKRPELTEIIKSRYENIQKENDKKYIDTLSKKLSDIRSIVSLNSEAITSDAKIALIIEVLK